MLHIIGRTTSSNVQKVLWTCTELDIPYERTDAGLHFGVNDTPEYLAKNPNGLVPTVEDGDAVLWESNSIVRYLAAKHNKNELLPTDLVQRALAERWMDWQLSAFWPPLMPAFVHLIRPPATGCDMQIVDRAVAATVPKAEILDAHLANNAYLGGDHLTVADIANGGVLHRWLNLEIDRPHHPNVLAYYDRLLQRPGYAEHVNIELV